MKTVKDLSDTEKYNICKQHMGEGFWCQAQECPLSITIDGHVHCWKDLYLIEEQIQNYWNKEISEETK
jgi:hypothetical protein